MPTPRRLAVKLELDWPYKRHAGVFAGLQRYALERGWHTIVDEFADDTLLNSSEDVLYDGVIARVNKTFAQRCQLRKVPLVNVWSSSPVRNLVPSVLADFAASGRLRAEHMLSRGLRRFAALITDHDPAQVLEVESIAQTLREAGCVVAVATFARNSNTSVKKYRKAQQTIDAWMEGWKLPIGVFVGTEAEGRIVAQKCHNRGWRVPEDAAILAGGNEETLCEGLRPTLSSVEFGYARVGYEAARLLDRLMNGEKAPTEPMLIPPVGLVVRESTDFFSSEDPVIAAALQFIATKGHLPIGQEDVARGVAVETRTLQRRFQKHLNQPIATVIRRARIERAKRELAQSEHSLKEIAKNVGFGEAMRMYEVFVRELGITPRQYRKERRGQLE